MSNNKFTGCGTALITPFNSNFEVDYEAYKNLVKRQINYGIHFLVPLGTTAETPCLTDEEKSLILKATFEVAQGKIPILVGAGLNSTQFTIENIKKLDCDYVDGLLIVTPYYNKPTQEGLIRHFTEVAKSTSKPIIMYNVPGRTGVNMSADTCLKLANIENIVGVKEASGHYAQISEIIKKSPSDFVVLSGNDYEVFSLMATGANGVISVASNIGVKEMSTMTEHLQNGKINEAVKIHHKLSPLFKNCFIESSPIPVKEALSQMGLIDNVLRLPLVNAQKSTSEIMRDTLKELHYV